MRPTDPVKDELRQKLSEISQFGSKITKMRASKFWILETQNFPAGGQCQPSHQQVLSKKRPPNPRIIQKNAGYSPKGWLAQSILSFKLFKNVENGHNSTHTHPNPSFLTGNSMPRPGEASGTGPGPKKQQKICKICLFGPFFGPGRLQAPKCWFLAP